MGLTFDRLEPGDFQPASVGGGLAKLVRIWEYLRDLNTGGYGGAVLVDVKDSISKGKSGITSCSPFTGTCIYMALDPRPFDPSQPWSLKEPYEPLFDGGKPLDANFYRLHNSFGLSTYANLNGKSFAGWKADFKKKFVDRLPQLAGDFSAFNFINHSAGSVVALNLGKPIEPKKMRRGDMVGIDWHSGNGHATFCWNVHLDKNGDVDCFQFISSNGTAAGGGAGITLFRYPDVDPAYLEKSGGKYKKKKDMFSGIIDDAKAYPEYIQKPYWWFGLPGYKKGDIDLDTFGVPAKTVQISYADSMDVAVHEVHVARLNGVTPPEPYLRADDGKTPEPQEEAKPPPLAKAKAKKIDEGGGGDKPKTEPEKAPPPAEAHPVQSEVEANLATLWMTRWISKDPGNAKSVNDAQTQAAIADYQRTYMKGKVPKLGVADPQTRQRLARAASSALAMPMVNAALALAHQAGEISSSPGTNAMQLDDATRAAVKEFQKKKGLDADGIPGHDTQEKLSAYMKEAALAAPKAPDQPAADQPADAKSADLPAAILLSYFTCNHGPSGKPITLNIVTTPACNGKSYSVSLCEGDKVIAKNAGKIAVADSKGTLELKVPPEASPGALLTAKISCDGLNAQTVAPYYVDKELTAKIVARTYGQFDDKDFAEEEPLRLHYVCVGTAQGEGIKARLNIIATGYIDLNGALVKAPPEEGKPPPEPLKLPATQKLYAYVHRKPAEVAKGVSKIPIALCDEIAADGAIQHRRLSREDPSAFRILEQKMGSGSGAPALGDIEHRDPPQVAAAELQRAFRELADAVRKQRGDR